APAAAPRARSNRRSTPAPSRTPTGSTTSPEARSAQRADSRAAPARGPPGHRWTLLHAHAIGADASGIARLRKKARNHSTTIHRAILAIALLSPVLFLRPRTYLPCPSAQVRSRTKEGEAPHDETIAAGRTGGCDSRGAQQPDGADCFRGRQLRRQTVHPRRA